LDVRAVAQRNVGSDDRGRCKTQTTTDAVDGDNVASVVKEPRPTGTTSVA